MKNPRKYLSMLSRRADLPEHIAAQLPFVSVDSYRKVSIDMQKGLLQYSDREIAVAVPQGKICVQGEKLQISLMKEEKIVVEGTIHAILFRVEEVV